MLHLGDSAGAKARVNVLKKVKVNGHWKLCPAIVEPGGKLKDRVQVHGQAEVHGEGFYYIEWREDSQRRRKAIQNRYEVLEHAQLKALELEAKKAGIAVDRSPRASLVPAASTSIGIASKPIELDKISSAAGVILRGVESYLQELITATVRSQLVTFGVATAIASVESPATLSSAAGDRIQEAVQQKAANPGSDSISNHPADGKTLIVEAIESYLKDVEPSQREQKTYDEYLPRLEQVFRDVCKAKVEDDGIRFAQDTVRAEEIRENQEYGGIRVLLAAHLDTARVQLQVDVGFGDVITPPAKDVELPTILDFPAARLRTYPRETVVAEKFQAMVMLGIANSRMRDFYDLWVLSTRFSFEGKILAEAIKKTFARRQTSVPAATPLGLTAEFYYNPGRRLQWEAFLRRAALGNDAVALPHVAGSLEKFLMPLALALSRSESFQMIWAPAGPWHKKA